MNDNLHPMPALATKDQQASQARPSPLRTYAAMGTYTKRSNLPEAPTSAGVDSAGEGGMVCEGGKVGHE